MTLGNSNCQGCARFKSPEDIKAENLLRLTVFHTSENQTLLGTVRELRPLGGKHPKTCCTYNIRLLNNKKVTLFDFFFSTHLFVESVFGSIQLLLLN